jgi:hypothetical protein
MCLLLPQPPEEGERRGGTPSVHLTTLPLVKATLRTLSEDTNLIVYLREKILFFPETINNFLKKAFLKGFLALRRKGSRG